MKIDQVFDKSVSYYDDWMRIALPAYQDLFDTAVESIPFDPANRIKVLDLGAGTGLFSWHVLQRYNNGEFLLYDLAEGMLNVAQERFTDRGDQFQYKLGDLRDLQVEEKMDLVISSLAIHHLSDHQKRLLFKKVFSILKSGGAFINVDQVKGPTDYFVDHYWDSWLAKVRAAGADEEQISASIHRRQTFDRDATLFDQLRWLQEAGFSNADCIYKNHFVAVLAAYSGVKGSDTPDSG